MINLRRLMNVTIENRLKSFFKTAVLCNFPWDRIPLYLDQHAGDVIKLTNPNVFCDFFVEVLENNRCESAGVFMGIIDIMTVLILEKEMRRDSLEDPIFSDAYEDFFRCKKKCHLALSILSLSKKLKHSVFPDRECIQAVSAFKTGNHRLLQLLATYGCPVNISEDSFFAGQVAATMIRKFIWIFKEQVGFLYGPEPNSATTLFNSRLSNVQLHLRYYDLVHLRDDPLWRPKTVSFKRLFLLILGIYALSLKLDNNPEFNNFIKCLDIYFKTITEPYLAVIEVRSLLINKDLVRNRKEYLVDEWCKVFENTMLFRTRNYEPRKLCHLARCQVRQNLCNSGSSSTLPEVLHHLKIPKKIKDFLSCKPYGTTA